MGRVPKLSGSSKGRGKSQDVADDYSHVRWWKMINKFVANSSTERGELSDTCARPN